MQRWWQVIGSAAVLSAAVSLPAAGCAEERLIAYTEEMETDFLEACQAGAAEAVCSCTWKRITAELHVQDFVDAAEDLDEQGLPPELAALASDCATRVAVGAEP